MTYQDLIRFRDDHVCTKELGGNVSHQTTLALIREALPSGQPFHNVRKKLEKKKGEKVTIYLCIVSVTLIHIYFIRGKMKIS